MESMYDKTVKVGQEMEQDMGGNFPGDKLLDICFALGGFLAVFLGEASVASNTWGHPRAWGLSLPVEDGRLPSILSNSRFTNEMLDITLLIDKYVEKADNLKKKV